jgi:protein-tyrosine phosphatase
MGSGYYDIHSHILHGLDDGPGTMEASLELVKAYIKDGTSGVIATPHFPVGNNVEAFLGKRDEAIETLRKAIKEKGLKLDIKPGAEVMMKPREKNGSAYAEIENNVEKLCMGDSNLILVEYQAGPEPVWFEESLYWLQRMGIQPILAHAERYGWLKNRKKLSKLIDKGIYIQINSGSLKGLFTPFRAFASALLRSDSVHFIATDAHDTKARRPNMTRIDNGQIYWHLENSRALYNHKGEHIFYVS